jgi:hypothetical protein
MTGQPEQPPILDVDQRPRQLLEKYASLMGSMLLDTAEGLVEFDVPESEQRFWGAQTKVRVALLPEALDDEPEAEILTVGSPLFDRLIAAIRARGFRESRGVVPTTENPTAEAATLPVHVEGATVDVAGIEIKLLPVGRLLARVSIRAGARLEERLVETPPVDLSTGSPLAAELSAHLAATPPARNSGSVTAAHAEAQKAVARPASELLPMMFGMMETALAPELSRARDEAARSLGSETQRLNQYYEAMLSDVEPEEDDVDGASDRKAAIEAERARRREEEEERSALRVTVHPLQMTEWQVLAQRASWRLATVKGRSAELHATRLLTGSSGWQLDCPSCGVPPTSIRVCREGHPSCPACSEVCGVCGEMQCRSHGLAVCAVEGHPVCAEDARSCMSCGAGHCAIHRGHCGPGDHDVCPTCAVHCERCAVEVCKAHATRTGEFAPRGARWLCAACVVTCEGGTNEPVGLDEAVRCTSCERHICEAHQVLCAVDQKPHCSRHLRRSDHSGRLSCEAHRSACADEPGSSMASDEVTACAKCSRGVCDKHGGKCDADGATLCVAHLAKLADKPGALACEAHRTVCHVDAVTFSVTGTQQCPVCGKAACLSHRVACGYCARQVCVRDVEQGRCRTCLALQPSTDPPEELLQAALTANGGEPIQSKSWRTSRDTTSTVVELDLGWTRRLVFSVANGDAKPRTVVRHSMLGSSRKR